MSLNFLQLPTELETIIYKYEHNLKMQAVFREIRTVMVESCMDCNHIHIVKDTCYDCDCFLCYDCTEDGAEEEEILCTRCENIHVTEDEIREYYDNDY